MLPTTGFPAYLLSLPPSLHYLFERERGAGMKDAVSGEACFILPSLLFLLGLISGPQEVGLESYLNCYQNQNRTKTSLN